jgi:hypothetical protein
VEIVSALNTHTLSYAHAKSRKHGTFRPALLGLVQSNTESAVQETTQKAYDALSFQWSPDYPSPLPALKILVGLKGVGPATASLLLSVLRPKEIPFFSDELFRWCAWDAGKGKEGEGWERKIKYNTKEYEVVVTKVNELRMRLGKGMGTERGEVTGTDLVGWAVHVEKVAWVLGKEGLDVNSDEENEAGQAYAEEVQEEKATEEDEVKPVTNQGTKRKAEVKTPAESTRKSMRTKK